jgi:hypothetical protein
MNALTAPVRQSTTILAMVGLLVISALSAPAAVAGEHKGEKKQERERHCLSIARVNRIEVVDDQTMLFHMNGGKKYINKLPYKCHGLKHNAFIHETSIQSYCDLDTITVYDASLGMRLGACPLGEFEPYEELDKPGE